MYKILLAITSCNQLAYTIQMLTSIRALPSAPFDILFVDDASEDQTVEYCRKWGINHVIAKQTPGGVTDSWNRAYGYFKTGPWSILILANNDVLLAAGAVEAMADVLFRRTNAIVGPLCNPEGAPYNAEQWTTSVTPPCPEAVELPSGKNVNGFFFGVHRRIVAHEFAPGLLFNPDNLNYGNEDELAQRLYPQGFRSVVATRAVVFHYKNRSFRIAARADQERMNDPALFHQHRASWGHL